MKRRAVGNFVLFDVTYADGSRSSNRKVPNAALEGPEGMAAAQAVIEAQDEEIARSSGRDRREVTSVARSRKA
jgi:hypothetical protein